MSPQNALIYVENIRKALVELDPPNAATMPMPTPQKIKDIDQTLRKELAVIPQTNATWSVVSAFSYLPRDYELKELYLWAVKQQATPKQVEKVIKSVREKIPVVL